MVRASWGLGVTVLGGLAIVLVTQLSPSISGATKTGDVVATSPTAGRFVVHEWGTFTSFSGSNGVQLDFRPLLDSDLPSFVLNRERQAGARSMLTKSSLWAPLRMETPVTYFYVDEPREVEVKVSFPDGLLTEFYPPVRGMQPAYNGKRPEKLGPSELNWGKVQLIPEAALRPKLGDETMSKLLAHRLMEAAPPHEFGQFHYDAARATDSALVAVNLPESADAAKSPLNVPPPSGLHVEKFLFYRGVGKFPLPLSAEVQSDGRVQVQNTGGEPIRSLFLIDVTSNNNDIQILRTQLAALDSKSAATLPPLTEPITLNDLRSEVQRALVQEGLFEKEAAAMVQTWSDSWFREPGLRLFYMLPSAMTDSVLPLHITPPADETVRVMVGRMEIMPPSQEEKLSQAVALHRKLRERRREEGNNEPLPPPAMLRTLGRFAEPALVRVRELAENDADAYEASILLRELRAAQ